MTAILLALAALIIQIYGLPDRRRRPLLHPFSKFLRLPFLSQIAIILSLTSAILFSFFAVASAISVAKGGEPGSFLLISVAIFVAMFLSICESLQLLYDVYQGRTKC